MEIKVNDYVRTKQGRIGKISNLTVDYSSELILCEESSIPFGKYQIIKSSPQIIDLIEVGDYVNGFEVLRIDKECNLYPKTLKCQYPNNIDYFDIFNEDIKSIVTKEQFEQMEYKID